MGAYYKHKKIINFIQIDVKCCPLVISRNVTFYMLAFHHSDIIEFNFFEYLPYVI